MPEQYLPISDALGRDIDSGKAADRDIADFLPDDVAQELLDDSHPGPVHAENLIPISPQQGAALRTIDPESGTLPMFPATRRVIPAPFKRDRVVGGTHGKTWTIVLGSQVRKGDIITDVGLVTGVQQAIRYGTEPRQHSHEGDGTVEGCPGCFPVAVGRDYVVTGAGGRELTYDANAEVKVFRRTS